MARAPDERIEQAKAMYLKGMKLVEIASQLNVSEGTVRSFNKFYDYEKEIDKAKGKQHEKGRFLGLSRYLKKREK